MALIDAARAEALYRADGAGDRGVGRLGRQHHRRRSPRSAATAPISARCATTSWAACFAHDLPRHGRALRHAGRDAAGPARRAASSSSRRTRSARMNTYLGACVELGPDDIDARLVAAGAGHLSRGLSVRSAAGAKAAFRKAAEIAHDAGPARSASRCPTRSASSATAPISATWCATMSISCSPTRSRSARSTRPRISTRPPRAVRGQCEIAALTRSAARLGHRHAGQEHVASPAAAGRRGGRHHRRRRSLCRGLPLWLDPRRGSRPPAAGSAASAPPRSSPFRRPARRRRSRSSPRQAGLL